MERHDRALHALMLLESTGAPISRPSRSELQSRLVEGEYDVMGGIQAKIERGGPGNRSLHFDKWVERHWRNAVVASARRWKALHVLVIQLSYGQTTSGSLHEHCNL
ncbi:hypothetical protein DM02DRAFT_249885 [Periconia macrospinosa]|uniref:Uncharacterized protein n=1 Tax=Periconia macrospinosa TaxID=97972 RepID=A0A2V1D769_9PLEO|nr:hypothetical protein DM02DRAFT_249885 [Periconia macrospinosa]